MLISKIKFLLFGNQLRQNEIIRQGKIKKKIAILAIFPIESSGYLLSLGRIISGLEENNYTIICISNSLIPQSIQILLEGKDHFLISRKNLGRDFGAYQAGINWLKRQDGYLDITNLILVNDTLLWFANAGYLINKLERNPWSTLFLNEEMHTHAQSFCLHFQSKVFNSHSFSLFWKKYLPTNYRRYAIVSGEVGLTNTLLLAGFRPKPLASIELFQEKHVALKHQYELAKLLPVGASQSARNLPLLFAENLDASYVAFKKEIGSFTPIAKNPELFALESWLKRFIHSDPPHRIGLHLALLYRLPIKRDMYKFHSLDNIATTLYATEKKSARCYLEDIENSSAKFMLGTRNARRARRHGEL